MLVMPLVDFDNMRLYVSNHFVAFLPNVDDEPEVPLSHGKSETENNPLSNKGPSVVSTRGGGDHSVGGKEGGSPTGGPSGSRGNRVAREPR
ncbi:hypothetical protein AVEN_37514-1, partial [Araneus ventricosus]